MAVNVVLNGVTYAIPTQGDVNWGPPLTRYLVALANTVLTPASGSFPLTADLNFGPNFGLFAKYYTSITANPATAGVLRLAKTDTIDWRNNANSGNNSLSVNGTDQLTFNGTPLSAAASLTDSHIFVGNVSNQPADVAMTGAVTISDTGVTTLSAGIPLNKLAALTPSTAVATDGSGFLVSSSTTDAELGFVHGVTSAIQTQINAIATTFLPLAGGTMSGPIDMGSNKITNLAGGNSNSEAVNFGQISGQRITQLQIHFNATQDSVTPGTANTYANFPNTSVTITPLSASSTILIFACGTVDGPGTPQQATFYTLRRGTTQIGHGEIQVGPYTGSNAPLIGLSFFTLEASPGTSAVTYSLATQWNGTGVAIFANTNFQILAVEIG